MAFFSPWGRHFLTTWSSSPGADADPDWEQLRIDTGHDCMVTEPKALTRMLIDRA